MTYSIKIQNLLFVCVSFFFTGIKETVSQNVHQEIETTEGGGWFASGDHYMYESTSKWFCFIGVPIWRLDYKCVKTFYCFEYEEPPLTRKVLIEKHIK